MTVYLLNLADLALTLYALSVGCRELNPLMQSVPAMVVYKVIIVGGLCWWLSRRAERIAKRGLTLCAAAYGGLLIYHIHGIFMIGGIFYGLYC
jgi:hypothetical protein